MADVLKLPPFHLSRGQGQTRMFALQGLHPGHSSVLITRSPAWAKTGASRYRSQMSLTLASNCSSSGGVSQ
jgi:hypothetical protein